MPTPHNTAPLGAFAPTVIMPGDPLRAQAIARDFLSDARLVNHVRGIQGYTGTYCGKPVSVMASGMGMPSMCIYATELFREYDVRRIIRVGTAGAMTENLRLRDVVAAMSASTDSNIASIYDFRGTISPTCSYAMLKQADDAAQRMRINLTVGSVFSSDIFYEGENPSWKKLTKLNVLCVEMETYALYLAAAATGREALSLLSISNSMLTGEALSAEERQTSLRDMIRLALEIA